MPTMPLPHDHTPAGSCFWVWVGVGAGGEAEAAMMPGATLVSMHLSGGLVLPGWRSVGRQGVLQQQLVPAYPGTDAAQVLRVIERDADCVRLSLCRRPWQAGRSPGLPG